MAHGEQVVHSAVGNFHKKKRHISNVKKMKRRITSSKISTRISTCKATTTIKILTILLGSSGVMFKILHGVDSGLCSKTQIHVD